MTPWKNWTSWYISFFRPSLAAFSHGNLAVEIFSKIFLTIQDSANAVSVNTFLSRDKCLECLPSWFMDSCQTTCKIRDSFISWTCGKMSHTFSSVIFNSDEDFRIASCIAPQTWYLHSIQMWRVIRWPLFLFKHLWTVLVEELLRDTCNACKALCILLNLPFHLAAVGCTLQWILVAEINKTTSVTVCNNIYTNITS